jgi:hypothetical protein
MATPTTPTASAPANRLCADGCGRALPRGTRRKYLEGHAFNYARALDASDLSKASAAAFWADVRVADNGMCWEWAGRHRNGYGLFRDPVTRKRYLAHRLAAALVFGPLPPGVQRNHSCDIGGLGRSCVNPWHTWAGSQSENLYDAAAKGLMPRKLSPSNVLELRELRRVGRVGRSTLAARFGISEHMVDLILKGRAWLHLLEPGTLIARFYARKGECGRGHAFTPENTIICSNGRRLCRTCKAARDRRTREEFQAGAVRVAPARTHCRHGHPLDEANTGTDCYGYRACRVCQRDWCRAYRARKKVA